MKSLYQLLFFVLGFALQSQSQIRVIDHNSEAYELAPDSAIVLGSGEMSIELQDSSGTWHQVGVIVAKNTSVVTKPWFIILLTTLLGFCAYLFYKFISNKSRKEAVMEAKLAHLERSALQAQMNPHFIFNSLNSIQSYIANNENDRANRFLAKFAKLIRSMLNHSRAQKVTLQEEIDSLTLYMDLEKMRFKDKFDFEVHIDEDIETYDIQIPPLLIQPYLENAIIHGLAQKRSQGKINLYYILEGKYLHATVTDNGIGIEQSKQQKKGESLHKSVGMTVTQKRLEMLDEGNTDKKVFIEEIKDRKGEVLGTKVEVKILIT